MVVLRDELKPFMVDHTPDPHDPEILNKYEADALGEYIRGRKKVVDIGCGLGRSSVAFYHAFDMKDAIFYLVDYDEKRLWSDYQVVGGRPLGYSSRVVPITCFKAINAYCTDNGFVRCNVRGMNTKYYQRFKGVDLLYSFFAVGFHFPIQKFIEEHEVGKFTSDDVVLIFGVRKEGSPTYEQSIPPEYVHPFELVERIKSESPDEDFVVYKKVVDIVA